MYFTHLYFLQNFINYSYSGYLAVKRLTLSLASFNLVSLLGFFSAKLIIRPTSLNASSSKPLVVAAGVPKRIPLVTKAFS